MDTDTPLIWSYVVTQNMSAAAATGALWVTLPCTLNTYNVSCKMLKHYGHAGKCMHMQ